MWFLLLLIVLACVFLIVYFNPYLDQLSTGEWVLWYSVKGTTQRKYIYLFRNESR